MQQTQSTAWSVDREVHDRAQTAIGAISDARRLVAEFGRDDLVAQLDAVRTELRRIRDAHAAGTS